MKQNESAGDITDVPDDYVPYDRIDLCGNQLIGVKYIIEVRNSHPLLIGRAKFPYIWMSAPTAPNQDVRHWQRIVERSTARIPVIDIDVKMDRRTMAVRLTGQTLLVISEFEDNFVAVSEVDLRPIGLMFYGSNGRLYLGTTQFVNNNMHGGNSFLAVN